MKIAILGAFGTAKTALGYRLAACSELNGQLCHIVDDVSRFCPLPTFEQITVDSAYYLVSDQIVQEVAAKSFGYEIIICQSSTIDPILYLNTRNFKNHYEELRSFASNWMHTYDIILYVIPPEHDLAPTDDYHTFQEKVDDEFNEYLESIFKNYLKTNIYKIKSDDIFNNGICTVLKELAGEEDWIKNFL